VFLRDIERLIKRSIPQQVIAGFEPDPNAVAQPVFAPRGRGRTQGQRPATPSRNPRGSHARSANPSATFRGRQKTKH
jgi:ATP-dependent RNA helicase RhlE